MLIFLLIVGETLATAFIAYVLGRILLPEVGLTAPGYWTWFWVCAIYFVFEFVRSVIKGAIE